MAVAATRIPVRLTPRGGSDRVERVESGMLRVRVTAAPVDGAANASLLRLLAAELGVPPSAVRLAAGATSRVKVVEIEGLDAAAIRARWPGLGG
jgi:uncharacterized protein YggU (UPF0235/DUF167 family)